MKIKHLLCALLVAVVWGCNFVAIKTAFADLPPFLLLTIRFILASVPFLFFIPRPKVSFSLLLSIALSLSFGHFGLLYLGIYSGVSAGVASLILQCQTIFTVVLAIVILGTKPNPLQLLGIFIALAGILLIATQSGWGGSLLGFCLLIAAALSSSIANIVFRKNENTNILSLIVWSNLIPPIPFFILSLTLEGWPTIVESLQGLSISGCCATVYTSWMSSLFAMSMWGWLMNKYDPAKVVPFASLIPIIGMTSTSLVLGEVLTQETIIASIVVLTGLIVNQSSSLMAKRKTIKLQTRSGHPMQFNEAA